MPLPSFLRRLASPFLSPSSPEARIQEQINPTAIAFSPTQEDWYWGRLASGSEEDWFWRRLSDNWYQKDVIPSTYLELHNACYEAYNANPLAFAVVEITTSFVLGKGVTVAAREPEVQRVLMDFWNDADNHMDMRVYSLCTELSLYGEQFIRFFVNPYDGRVKIRQVDPSVIDQIETDPDDIETPLRFHRRPIDPSASYPGDPVAQTLAPFSSKPLDSGPISRASVGRDKADGKQSLQPASGRDGVQGSYGNFEGEWFKAGSEVMQFCVNKVSNAKRGKSDLATLLPWLRRYKDWLTDRVRINKYKGAFLWDVELKGADKKTVDRKKMEYGYPPEPGSVVIHNEAEQWSAVKPEINANGKR